MGRVDAAGKVNRRTSGFPRSYAHRTQLHYTMSRCVDGTAAILSDSRAGSVTHIAAGRVLAFEAGGGDAFDDAALEDDEHDEDGRHGHHAGRHENRVVDLAVSCQCG